MSELKCIHCNDLRKNKNSLVNHQRLCKSNPNRSLNNWTKINSERDKAWNKGLTKFTDDRVKKSGETYSNRIKSGEIEPSNKGKFASEETKSKISESMKLAHAEGRAWNIGRSRWNNEQSYPEKFFSKVIENEFEDKNYSSEYNVGNYSIDFAWVDKKLAIEIDGDQHIRFQHQIDSDKRKDKLLTSEGWKVLRIRWKDMCNDSKKHIQIAKSFVH